MGVQRSSIHSFIVKIWLEEATEKSHRGTWRGHITHVPSGERSHLKDLDEITTFIGTFLHGMGIQPGKYWRVKRWLNRFKYNTTLML